MKEPRPIPKGPTVSVTLRVPVVVVEQMKNLSMFNKFSPFQNVSQFGIDAFIRNLEFWKESQLSDRYERALLEAELLNEEQDKARVAGFKLTFAKACADKDKVTALKILAAMPSSEKPELVALAKTFGIPMLEVVAEEG